jgi:hypothetical protein
MRLCLIPVVGVGSDPISGVISHTTVITWESIVGACFNMSEKLKFTLDFDIWKSCVWRAVVEF